jgi:hypothetical protein
MGYGADGSDGYGTATEISGLGGLADQLSDELKRASESAYELAYILGDNEDYKEAWQEVVRSDNLQTLSKNFSIEREDAPAYKDDMPAWQETVLRLLAENFSPYVQISHNTGLYAWECATEDCEHLNDSED